MFTHQFVTPPVLERIDEPGKRGYRLPTGEVYPSVTTILKELPNPALDAWRKRVGPKRAEKIGNAAADRGTALHTMIERHLLNLPREQVSILTQRLYNQVWPIVNAINNIRLIETPIYSHRMQMAGTPDCIADYYNVLSVLDFKTSTRDKKEDWISGYFAQAGAYSRMYHELYGVMPQKCVIIVAVEESNQAQVFVKDSSECFALLRQYVTKLIDYRSSNSEDSPSDAGSGGVIDLRRLPETSNTVTAVEG